MWAHRHLLMRWFCWFCQCWRFWWRRLVWCEVTGWGLRGILCSGIDFSGIFGEAILHLSVLTPNAPRAGCVSLHPPPWLSLLTPFRQELSVCVFAWHWDFIVAYSDCRFSCITLSRISPTWGTAPWLLPWCSRAGDTLEGTTFLGTFKCSVSCMTRSIMFHSVVWFAATDEFSFLMWHNINVSAWQLPSLGVRAHVSAHETPSYKSF